MNSSSYRHFTNLEGSFRNKTPANPTHCSRWPSTPPILLHDHASRTVTFTVLAPYNAAPHNRYQPHPAEPAQHTTCSNTSCSPEDGHNVARNMLRQKLLINIWLLHLVGFLSLSLFTICSRCTVTEPKAYKYYPYVLVLLFYLSSIVCQTEKLFVGQVK